MTNFKSRSNELKINFNNHLKKLTRIEDDFYSKISNEDILKLKTVLSDINNLLTYKLTLEAGEWIGNFFKLKTQDKKSLLNKIDGVDPNAQGFDIVIENPIRLIAEVKCNVPVKEGVKYGAMQTKHLIEDVQKLLKGKKQIPDTSDYLKFVFIINIEDKTSIALKTLTQKTKIRKSTEERLNRNIARDKMIIFSNEKHNTLDKSKVYLKTLDLTKNGYS